MFLRTWLKHFTGSELIRGSTTVFVGNNILSAGNFFYNVLMGRMLGPEIYGNLGALFSLLVLLAAPLTILQLLVVKQTSIFWGKKERGKIHALQSMLFRKLLLLGISVSIIVLIGNGLIHDVLHIDSLSALVVFSLSFLLSGPATVNRSILQGTLSFGYLTMNNAVEAVTKITISVLFVLLNFQLTGALLGPFAAGIASYLLSVVQTNMIFRSAKEEPVRKPSVKDMASVSPLFFASLSLTLFFTMDIILVRSFLSADIAGEYTALSLIGKILFYAIGPVQTVMFPLISVRSSSGKPYIRTLLATLLLSLGVSVLLIFFYSVFPKLVVSILFGKHYFHIIPYIGLFSCYMALYSLNSILTHFLLSISCYKPIVFLFIIALTQSIGIILFHGSITHVIVVNLSVSILYFIVCVHAVWQKEKQQFYSLLSRA